MHSIGVILVAVGVAIFLVRYFVQVKCPYCASRKTKIRSSEPDPDVEPLGGAKRLILQVHCNYCGANSRFVRIGILAPDGWSWLPDEHLP